MEHVQLNISGIQCDNENCDYREMDVKLEDYPQWLNKPCPKCGENLLTEDDYNETLDLMKKTELINAMSDEQIEALNKQMMHAMNMDENITNQMLDFINKKNLKFQDLENGGFRIYGGWHKKFDEKQ